MKEEDGMEKNYYGELSIIGMKAVSYTHLTLPTMCQV